MIGEAVPNVRVLPHFRLTHCTWLVGAVPPLLPAKSKTYLKSSASYLPRNGSWEDHGIRNEKKGPRRPRPIQCHPGIETSSSASIRMIVAAPRAISAGSRLRMVTHLPAPCRNTTN